MSSFFEKDAEFYGLNLLIQASNSTMESTTGVVENYQNITPKPTMKSIGMDETAPKPTASKGPLGEEIISRLSRKLKGLIRQAVAIVKRNAQAFVELQAANKEVVRATPVSYHVPEDYNPSTVVSLSEKKRQRTALVGEIQTTFEIPEGHDSELDKLLQQTRPEVKRDVGLKFLERLKGWKLQCRQRIDGKLDTYFHHRKSNEIFRSNIEVVTFILYEICPRHLKRATKAANEKFSGSNGEGGVQKRPWTSSCCHSSGAKPMTKQSTAGISEEEEKAVKEFLETAYNNLMNYKGDNENTPPMLKACNDKYMDDTRGASTASASASSEATIEDFCYLENTQGTKRKRSKNSSSATSRRVEKSPYVFATPSVVNSGSDATVEVQEKMASASGPVQPKPSPTPYPDLSTYLANLKYRSFSDLDDFFS